MLADITSDMENIFLIRTLRGLNSQISMYSSFLSISAPNGRYMEPFVGN